MNDANLIHTPNGDYIQNWLVLTPYLSEDAHISFQRSITDSDYQPVAGDTFVAPDGETFVWKRYHTHSGTVYPPDAIGWSGGGCGYVCCSVLNLNQRDGWGEIIIRGIADYDVWWNGCKLKPITCYIATTFSLGRSTCYVFLAHFSRQPFETLIVRASRLPMSYYFGVRVLPPNRCVLHGDIVDQHGNQIPEQVTFLLQPEQQEPVEIETVTPGRYRLSLYPAPELHLKASCGERGGMWPSIHLEEGEERRLDLVLQMNASISGDLLMLDRWTPHTGMPVQLIQGERVIERHNSTAKADLDILETPRCLGLASAQVMGALAALVTLLKRALDFIVRCTVAFDALIETLQHQECAPIPKELIAPQVPAYLVPFVQLE